MLRLRPQKRGAADIEIAVNADDSIAAMLGKFMYLEFLPYDRWTLPKGIQPDDYAAAMPPYVARLVQSAAGGGLSERVIYWGAYPVRWTATLNVDGQRFYDRHVVLPAMLRGLLGRRSVAVKRYPTY